MGPPGVGHRYRDERRGEAGLHLVGRGLLEGLLAGALLAPCVLLAAGLGAVLLEPGASPVVDENLVTVLTASVMVGALLGLAGGVLAVVSIGVVVRWGRTSCSPWTSAWLAPALVVGLATLGLAVAADFWVFYPAALPAAAVTAWRSHRAVTDFRRRAELP
ncbi:hypothetical protein [Aquipuribacter hungaricus]|uniref:Uncharacterized protein n=1 Tax=Aquipuribacter hungaricus TaxID=545624 RepID=A0ABV7WK46_9MICO